MTDDDRIQDKDIRNTGMDTHEQDYDEDAYEEEQNQMNAAMVHSKENLIQ